MQIFAIQQNFDKKGFAMSNYRRVYVQGGAYFFTVVLQNRGLNLLCRYIDEFRMAYAKTISCYHLKTIAICVLPEHFHWVVQLQENEKDYSKILSNLKRNFSKNLPQKYKTTNQSRLNKRELGIWQRRFWEHCIRDETDLQRHIYYTYFNPVKHGLVKRVCDWEFSSFHRDVKSGLFAADWGSLIDNEIINLYDE